MRFFHPKKKFFTWLKGVLRARKHKSCVVDCGAGKGDLVWELLELKIPCVGLDPLWVRGFGGTKKDMELSCKMIAQPAETSSFVTDFPFVLLCCRPCHSGFPDQINRARHPESVFYYIGLRKNLAADLAGSAKKLVLEDVGEEGECIWEVLQK
jgi:hypothetical protein